MSASGWLWSRSCQAITPFGSHRILALKLAAVSDSAYGIPGSKHHLNRPSQLDPRIVGKRGVMVRPHRLDLRPQSAGEERDRHLGHGRQSGHRGDRSTGSAVLHERLGLKFDSQHSP